MARVLFLTQHDPTKRRYWNTQLCDGLAAAGVDVRYASWNDEEATLIDTASSCTHVCLITAAHYNHAIDSFKRLLSTTLPEVQRRTPSLRVCNAVNLTLWNSDKSYLLDLQRAGFILPQTAVAEQRQSLDQLKHELKKFVPDRSSQTVIVKPSVGASGLNVLKIDDANNLSEADSAALNHLLDTSTEATQIILQEFIADIKLNGELSLVYVGGKLITGILKQVARDKDEFRINSFYGGRAERIQDTDIPQSARQVGDSVFKWLNQRFGPNACAYMRLDGVMRDEDGAFVLMEIECIEPSLLTSNPDVCASLVEHFKEVFASKD